MSHITVLERMIAGDITYDDNGLLDKTHLRFFSPASITKALLDSGWMPNLADYYTSGYPNRVFAERIMAAGEALGMPIASVQRSVYVYQLILESIKAPEISVADGPPITVIVAVNRDNQLSANLLHSPGLAEINPQIVTVRDATSAAEAYERGLAQAEAPWVIYAHQDVYFPKGSGYALRRLFSSIPERELADTIVGFAGIALDEQSRAMKAGLAIDRWSGLIFRPASAAFRSTSSPSRCTARTAHGSITGSAGTCGGRTSVSTQPCTDGRWRRSSGFRCSTIRSATPTSRRRSCTRAPGCWERNIPPFPSSRRSTGISETPSCNRGPSGPPRYCVAETCTPMPACASESGAALAPVTCDDVPNGLGVFTALSSWSVVEAENV